MNIQLHLGDCLEVMRSMPDKSVDAVITDPPYGIGEDVRKADKSGVAELEGEENSGARWKRFPFLIMGLVFIAFGGWLFGRTIELSNEQIVGLVSALYFICVGQIYLAEFQKRSDDK